MATTSKRKYKIPSCLYNIIGLTSEIAYGNWIIEFRLLQSVFAPRNV